MILSHIVIGLIMSAVGIALAKYSYQAYNFTGPQDWLESITGSGTTSGIYKIFGVILVFLGLLIATGFGNNILSFFLAPLRGVFGLPSN